MKVALKNEKTESMYIADVEVLEKGALDTRSGKHIRPWKIKTPDGRVIWVTEDEGDGRTIPGEFGPFRMKNLC